jgi:hypothetical protein
MDLRDHPISDILDIEDIIKWKDLIYLYKLAEEKEFQEIMETVSHSKKIFACEIGYMVLDVLVKEIK